LTTTPTGGTPEYDPFNAPAPMPAMPEVGPPTPFPKPPPLSVLARVSIVLGVVVALGLGSLVAWGISQSGKFATVEAGKCLYLTDEPGDEEVDDAFPFADAPDSPSARRAGAGPDRRVS